MIAAQRPAVDDKELYNGVVQRRHAHERLKELAGEVFRRYDKYTQCSGLCAPQIWADNDRHILSSNWSLLNSGQLVQFRPEIFSSTRGICFLCGNSKAGEIDHYLPRKHFPEYSILTLNLLPACRECNNAKRAQFEDSGSYLYFHPHFMTLPDTQFVTVTIELDATVLITYEINPNLQGELPDILRRQFKSLSLGKMYRDEAVGLLSECSIPSISTIK